MSFDDWHHEHGHKFQAFPEAQERAARAAWNAALSHAAKICRELPDRERMDANWNPDPSGMLMEHCPLSCALAIEKERGR